MIWYALKGSFIASLLVFSVVTMAQSSTSLSSLPQWRALLHIPSGHSHSLIDDPDFVPQTQHGIAELALQQTHSALQQNDLQFLCRFPARALWLQHQLSQKTTLDWSACPELQTFLKEVPVDRLKLVYAYESVSQPASMMGHILLLLEGTGNDHTLRQHGVSFFTDVEGWNAPKLFLDATLIGKVGHFALTPYHESLHQYQTLEQRNVIEYDIATQFFQRRLLQLHIWELKQTRLTYYFHRYNCATLTNDLLALLAPSQSRYSTHWLSPLDVVKATNESGILRQATLKPSDAWQLKMYLDALRLQGEEVRDAPAPNSTDRALFLQQSFALAVRSYDGPISAEEEQTIKDVWPVKDEYQISLDGYQNPLQRPDDAQTTIALNDRGLSFEWMPISHQLSDDLRHTSAESQLKIFAISSSFDRHSGELKLDELALYDMTTLAPYNRWTKQWSGSFYAGAKRMLTSADNSPLVAVVEGGIGRNYEWQYGLQTYALFNLGLTAYHEPEIFYGPELGIIAYEKGNLKTHLNYRININQLGLSTPVHTLNLDQSWFFRPNHNLLLNLQMTHLDRSAQHRIQLAWRQYF